MKNIFFALFIFPAFMVNAQKLSGFRVGINLYTYEFIKIIRTDVQYNKDNQNIPNGVSAGLTIGKEWNNKWGIKTGFEYSYQNEKTYILSREHRSMNYKFIYYKIPLSVELYHHLIHKIYFSLNQGIQISYLKYFEGIHTNYDLITTINPSGHDYYSNVHPEWIYYSPRDNWKLFWRTQFGIIGNVGMKGALSTKLSYSTNIKYEYDITLADREEYFYFGEALPEMRSHNFRIGLELGLQYLILLKHKNRPDNNCDVF